MKIIEVKVYPNSKKEMVQQVGAVFRVHVRAPAEDGKANRALIEVLSAYFDVKKGAFEIIRGETSRIKLIRILE